MYLNNLLSTECIFVLVNLIGEGRCECDLTAIREQCYASVGQEWPLTNSTGQSEHSICCWHWDVFDCVQFAACDQCSEQLSDEIEAEQTRLKQNLMNGTCHTYPYRTYKCRLNIAFYSLCFYGICFLVAVIYLSIAYWNKREID